MATSAMQATMLDLERAAKKTDSVIVAYSGGKDSLCVLDLCLRSFKRVEAFFMYFVPGLACVEEQLDFARKRWGLTIHQYPHWILSRCLKGGAYGPAYWTDDDLPEMAVRDVYDLVIADTGIPLIAHGAKRGDSMWRKYNLANTSHYDDVFYPIVEWNKFDVLAHLKARGIPLPDSSGRQATGIDLTTPSLLWLHDEHPEDFRKLCGVFPYAEAVVWRRAWYGVE